MKYRKFGKLHWEISEISLGVLRLEDIAAAPGETDEYMRIAVIRYAIDHGVNYINLGYPSYFTDPIGACAYLKKALCDGYREKVKLAVNVPCRDVTSKEDLDKALDQQLRMFDLEKTDFCIVDRVYRAAWEKLKEVDIASWAESVITSGRAEHMGITFHDDAYYLKEINDVYPNWAVVQMELSMLDYKHHPGAGGFKFTQQYGNAVVATDITKANRLLRNVPPNVQIIWDQAREKRSITEWCIRWTLNFNEVSSVLIHCDTIEQVKESLSYTESYKAGDADIFEILQATNVREAYYSGKRILCTACRCCMPCDIGIDVPRIVELYNDFIMFSDDRIPKFLFQLERHHNKTCIKCGKCLESCPKHFPLTDVLTNSQQIFSC